VRHRSTARTQRAWLREIARGVRHRSTRFDASALPLRCHFRWAVAPADNGCYAHRQRSQSAAATVTLTLVPQLASALDLDVIVERAVEAHRAELLALVRPRVEQAVDAVVAELLAVEIAARSNGGAPVEIEQADEATAPTTKVCTGCERELPLDEFYRDSKTKDGRRFKCKECIAALDEERRLAREQEHAAAPLGDGSTSTTSPAGTGAIT
jgi:hypothetical protein